MNNEILVKRINVKPPDDILIHIFRHMQITSMKDGWRRKQLQKEEYKQLIIGSCCYFIWLKENYINDFEFRLIWPLISFTFTNSEDAVAFKLRWL